MNVSSSPLCICLSLTVYMEGFIIAASNLPGNIFTILMMDSMGGKALLCESLIYALLYHKVMLLISVHPHFYTLNP